MRPQPRDKKGRITTAKKKHVGTTPFKVTRHYIIVARNKARTTRMVFTGRKFSNNDPPKPYHIKRRAFEDARDLLRDYPILRDYVVGVEEIKHQSYYKNPSLREGTRLHQASKLLEEFSGHEPTETLSINEPELKEGLAIGPMLGVMYETIRDGKREKYLHRFRPKSRPLLAVSSDGKKLGIIGGRFQFTAAGIEDR